MARPGAHAKRHSSLEGEGRIRRGFQGLGMFLISKQPRGNCLLIWRQPIAKGWTIMRLKLTLPRFHWLRALPIACALALASLVPAHAATVSDTRNVSCDGVSYTQGVTPTSTRA